MKYFLIFAGGFVAGAGVTLLWLRKEFNKKIEEEVEKINEKKDEKEPHEEGENEENSSNSIDIKDVKDRVLFNPVKLYEGLTDRLGYTNYAGIEGSDRVNEPINVITDNNENLAKNGEKNDEKTDENREKMGNCDDKNNVSLYVSLLDNVSEKSDTLGQNEQKLPSEDGNFRPPYGISDEEFYNKNSRFSKKTYVFYAEDGIFTDECVTLCANVSLLFGQKWHMEIGKFEKDVAFIRNEKMGEDYEIIVEHCAYKDVVKPNFGEV